MNKGVSLPPLRISWKLIVEEFSNRFCSVYMHNTAKVHLDVSNTMIDGAKEKWTYIVFLDCVLAFATHREFARTDCDRRRFDQYQALRESVCVACSRAYVDHIIHNKDHGFSLAYPSSIELFDVFDPWQTTDSLREHFRQFPTNKTWRKRQQIVNILITTRPCREDSLFDVFSKVVLRIYISVSLTNLHYFEI